MSLINDALKRAHDNKPTAPRAAPPPLQPAQHPPTSRMPFIVIPIGFLVIVAMGVWFVMKGIEVARHVSEDDNKVSARESALYQTEPIAPTLDQLPPPPPPPTTPTAQPPTPAVVPAPVPPPPDPNAFPTLKLQAVFYNANNPAVVINSKTLELGQRHKDVTVLSINRQSVIVQWRDETKELFLP